jgi:glucose uptake protein
VVLNLGTLLLLAAITISGMSVAFPMTLGVSLVIGSLWDFAAAERASAPVTLGGVALLLAAVVVIALAHLWRQGDRQAAAPTALRADPRLKPRRKSPGGGLAVILAIAGGIVLSIFPRTLAESTSGENGLAPYSALLLLAASALVSAPFFVLFFTTFPVIGAAGSVRGYLDGSKKEHLLGLTGGILWGTGMLCSLLAAIAPMNAQPGALIQYPLRNGALLVAAAWGLIAWGEFRGTSERVRMMVAGMLVLFLGGLGMVAFGISAVK